MHACLPDLLLPRLMCCRRRPDQTDLLLLPQLRRCRHKYDPDAEALRTGDTRDVRNVPEVMLSWSGGYTRCSTYLRVCEHSYPTSIQGLPYGCHCCTDELRASNAGLSSRKYALHVRHVETCRTCRAYFCELNPALLALNSSITVVGREVMLRWSGPYRRCSTYLRVFELSLLHSIQRRPHGCHYYGCMESSRRHPT